MGSQATDYGTSAQSWFLKIATGIDPGANDLSAVTWAYSTSIGNYRNLFQQEDGTGTGRGWLYVKSNSSINSFLGGSETTAGASSFSGSVWNHTVVTFPSSGGAATCTLYVNGSSVGSATRTGESATGDLRHGDDKSGTSQWAGYMVYSLVYNRSLSVNEVNEVMWNPYAIPDGLQWAPDELDTSATNFYDKSPAQRGAATVTGSPATYTGGGPPVFFLGGQ